MSGYVTCEPFAVIPKVPQETMLVVSIVPDRSEKRYVLLILYRLSVYGVISGLARPFTPQISHNIHKDKNTRWLQI